MLDPRTEPSCPEERLKFASWKSAWAGTATPRNEVVTRLLRDGRLISACSQLTMIPHVTDMPGTPGPVPSLGRFAAPTG